MNATSTPGALHTPIAIVGMASLFPGSAARDGFWKNILAGTDLTSDIPPGHWLIDDYYDPDPRRRGKTYARRGAFLPKVPFDPMEYGMPPASIPGTDTAQLLALLVARQVLEDALGGDFAKARLERASVILGVASATELVAEMSGSIQRPVWVKVLREAGIPESQVIAICDRIENQYSDWTEATFPGLLGNVVAGRIANRFNFGGTNCVVDAACASSLAAVRMAIQELESGASDLAITGGVDAINDIFMYMCFSKTPAMSPTGDCRPFSADADGTLLGEGLGMLALRRLADAERDGNKIYGVIRGLGASSDGRAKSIYAPRAEGQALALQRAYASAGYGPGTVELMEAHGTGTVAGDAAEVAALREVFGKDKPDARTWCALGSVKSQIGHTKSAAGAASLYKAVMALHHKVLPPTCKVSTPNPALKIGDSPFYLNTRARPWIRAAAHPRRASVSSFGFGGSNFHVTVEEYLGPSQPARIRPDIGELILLSAETREQLSAKAEAALQTARAESLAVAAKGSHAAFTPAAPHRAAIVAAKADDLAAKCAALRESRPAKGVVVGAGAKSAGTLAFLFPGQGSQYIGMGADAVMTFPDARAVWDRAASHGVSADLHRTVFPPPAFTPEDEKAQTARLTETDKAQPAVGLTSLAYLALLEAAGVRPDVTAGHSFGELTALFAAGVFTEDDFRAAALTRGRLMAEAAASIPGAMIVAVTDLATAESVAAGIAEIAVANHNGPNQVVLSGTVTAASQALEAFKARGISAKRLNVATAFHSPIVAPAAQPYAEALAGLAVRAPACGVYANSSAAPYTNDPAAIRTTLVGQITARVRFVEQIEAMYAAGVRTFVEVGPGTVLTDLVRQILGGRTHDAMAVDSRAGAPLAALWDTLGRLAVMGHAVDMRFAWDGYEIAAPPVAPPARALMIDGANYAKPYPPSGGAAALPLPNPEKVQVHPVTTEKTPAPPVAHDETISALERIHAQTAEAHRVAQQAMADAHIAYMRAAEQAIAQISGLMHGAPASGVAPMPRPQMPAAPVFAPPPPPAASPVAPKEVAVVRPPAPVVPAPAPAPVVTSADPQTLFLKIVAAKTGYPVDMLNLDMAMEADLGIDSIKRVEILSELQSQLSALKDIDARELSALPTLRDIVEHVSRQAPTLSPAAAPAPVAPQSAPAPRAPVVEIPTASDAERLFLEVVAAKTGYSIDMLTPDMELEADLGIDSIKRVEILSELQRRLPVLGDLDARDLASLPTLRSIIVQVTAQMGVAPPAQAPAAAAPVAALSRIADTWIAQVASRDATPGYDMGAHVALLAPGDDATVAVLGKRIEADGLRVSRDVADVRGADLVLVVVPRDVDGRAGVRLAFEAARIFAKRTDRGGHSFVVIAVDGAELDLAGLTRTAAQEWPDACVRNIVLEDASLPAEQIVTELLAGGNAADVKLLTDGRRLVRQDRAAALDPARTATLPDDAVLVVTGGGRGVTGACLKALAEGRKLRLAVLGRTALDAEPPAIAAAQDMTGLIAACAAEAKARGETLPPAALSQRAQAILAGRELRGTLSALEAAGATVLPVRADVSDAQSVKAAVADIRAHFGRIDGLIHGAGVLADSLIAEKTESQMLRVYDTKVTGLRNLLAAMAGDTLHLIAVFSSVSARYGNVGQADYAVANATMAAIAAADAKRRGAACALRIIDWGPWDGGMVNDGLRTLFAARGVPLIPLDMGAAAFVAEVFHGSNATPHVALFAGTAGAPLGANHAAVTA